MSVLFADLVGSTALGETLDPEEVKLVIGEAVARIVREVEGLGGVVKDLAGDGVLAFFGAPVASEDDAERAVRTGLRIAEEMRQYATEVAQAWGVEGFGVRVGVGTGPVVLGEIGAGSRLEYAAFGDTVNLAARLQSAAEPGTVLVDEATARAVEGAFDTAEPLSLELKGKSAPVTARAVIRAREGLVRRRGLAGADAALVGRDRELARADEWLERLRGGAGGALFLTGEAGIGKSRLMVELARRFAERPVEGAEPVWLEGRCVSYGESLPLWPFRDLLREWLGVSYRRAGAARARRAAPPRRGALRVARRRDLPLPGLGARHHAGARRGCPHRRALARGAPVPHVRGARRAPGAAGRGRPGRLRDRGPALGRPDLGAARRAAAAADRADGRAAADLAARGARPPVLGAEGAGGARVPASLPRARAGAADRGRRAGAAGVADRPRHASAGPGRADTQPGRGQSVLPRGARALAGGRGRARRDPTTAGASTTRRRSRSRRPSSA